LRQSASLFLVTGAHTAQARHGHEHVLKPPGDLGIEVNQLCIALPEKPSMLAISRFCSCPSPPSHRLHIRKSEEPPGLEGRQLFQHLPS
jgi:hypothetical protein